MSPYEPLDGALLRSGISLRLRTRPASRFLAGAMISECCHGSRIVVAMVPQYSRRSVFRDAGAMADGT